MKLPEHEPYSSCSPYIKDWEREEQEREAYQDYLYHCEKEEEIK